MKNLTWQGLIVIFFSLSSCKKDDNIDPFECPDLTSNLITVKTLVDGQWKWVKSRSISRTGEFLYFTPREANFDDYIRMYGDIIEFSRSSGEFIKRTYKILQEKDITNWPDDEATVLVTYDLDSGVMASYYPISVCNDYLILYQSYRSDIAPDIVYRRLK